MAKWFRALFIVFGILCVTAPRAQATPYLLSEAVNVCEQTCASDFKVCITTCGVCRPLVVTDHTAGANHACFECFKNNTLVQVCLTESKTCPDLWFAQYDNPCPVNICGCPTQAFFRTHLLCGTLECLDFFTDPCHSACVTTNCESCPIHCSHVIGTLAFNLGCHGNPIYDPSGGLVGGAGSVQFIFVPAPAGVPGTPEVSTTAAATPLAALLAVLAVLADRRRRA